jgi:outer membrane biosynthesis protein TonB
MKKALLIISLLSFVSLVFAQSPVDYFNRAANEYIYKDAQIALNTLDAGLSKYPTDKNLQNLKDKINKDKQKQDQKQKQQQEDQQKKEEENKQKQDQQKKEEEEKKQQQDQNQKAENDKNAEQKDQPQDAKPEETEEKGKEMDQPPQTRSEKLEELNLTEEKARMILEAMKNNEIQYIQQNKRNATKKPDSNKPDW